ncbi:orotate phosphoribosyltransferase [Dehalococcoidia bacterium]|nr:orotate phosphoribosyltransferase [Dehalococcoidia bacterium]
MVASLLLEVALNTESARRIQEIANDVGAFLKGEFVLSSGKKSDYYFEGKRITASPEGAYWVGKAVFDEVAVLGVDAVGGLATGAYPIATAVAVISHLEGKPIPWFIVREPKSHGTRRKIEGHLTERSKVVILDDVITTGDSVLKAIEAVEMANCEVVKVIVIVDRHEGGSDRLRKDGYAFDSILHLWSTGDVTTEIPKEVVLLR